jgi:hypothetical protein
MSATVDPIVEEVREARRQHAERFENDLRRIFDDLVRREEVAGRESVHGEPRRVGKGESQPSSPTNA